MQGDIGFTEDIVALVGEADRSCMKSVQRGSFDLFEYSEVQSRANLILKHLKGADGLPLMPPGGWPSSKIDKFDKWISEGMPKRRGSHFADFFSAIDGQTEYFDVYGADQGLPNMGPLYSLFFGNEKLLQKQWLDYTKINPVTPILRRKKELLWESVLEVAKDPEVKKGLLGIDDFILGLVAEYFGDDVDFDSLIGAYEAFGRDTLPIDEERVDKVKALGNPSDYRLVNDFARFHRMDTRVMWFFWFGHLVCTRASLSDADDENHDIRTKLLAALFVGQVSDTAFREGSNRQTRMAYMGDGGMENIRSTAEFIANDWDAGVSEMEELFWMWSATNTFA